LDGANSKEADKKAKHPVIHIMSEQKKLIAKKQYGGTVRLGAWPCKIVKNTLLAQAYRNKMDKNNIVLERHRHRYEVNNEYREILEKNGLIISGSSPEGSLVEAIEIKDHPFFVATQFHPEYISRPLDPHPLFCEFVKVCLKNK